VQSDEALEDSGDLKKGTGAHTIGIFFETIFPVGSAEVIGNREKIENLLYFAIAHDPPNAHASNVVTRHHYLEATGLDVEEIELFYRGADRAAADLLDNTHAMIGIDDLVADVEVQITVHKKAPGQERGSGENVVFTVNIVSRNGTKSKAGSGARLTAKRDSIL
jgi:hypothetical protein